MRRTMLCLILTACGPGSDDSNTARGRGLKPAALPVAAEASIYDASVRASFDVGPGLTLLLHPRRLPRTAGDSGGDAVPAALVRALRTRGVVLGVCEPRRESPRDTPRCDAPSAGYVIRGSDVLRVSKDTVEMYFSVERYGMATGQRPEALRFEKAYKLVGSGASWRVTQEGRVRQAAP